MKLTFFFTSIIISILLLTSCSQHNPTSHVSNQQDFQEHQMQLKALLSDTSLNNENRYAIINTLAGNMLEHNEYKQLVLFLTDWVERHPDDAYNTYWLFMTAYAYMIQESDPVAEYYLDRILENYPDILVKGQSVHFLCLQHLIRICTKTADRIKYFKELITRFPSEVSTTELYIRLALEYEKEGEWDQALNACSLFL
ncbi:MAG: tetratricopeptide repeat protein, partial [Treponema sp.]|nr:tetratricopeptide repeat protein [Treponema sp.]